MSNQDSIEKIDAWRHIGQKMITLYYASIAAMGENNWPIRDGYVNYMLNARASFRLVMGQRESDTSGLYVWTEVSLVYMWGTQTRGSQHDKQHVHEAKLFTHAKLVKPFPHAAQTLITLMFLSSLAPQTSSELMNLSSRAFKSWISHCLLLKFVLCSLSGFLLMKSLSGL